MKKFFKSLLVISIVIISIFLCVSDYSGNAIAKVRFNEEISAYSGNPSDWSNDLYWVDILEVYDWEALERVSQKISTDKLRANLFASEGDQNYESGKEYYVYEDFETLETNKRGIFFRFSSKMSDLSVFLILGLLFAVVLTSAHRN